MECSAETSGEVNFDMAASKYDLSSSTGHSARFRLQDLDFKI
jgi:hypothetical protein